MGVSWALHFIDAAFYDGSLIGMHLFVTPCTVDELKAVVWPQIQVVLNAKWTDLVVVDMMKAEDARILKRIKEQL